MDTLHIDKMRFPRYYFRQMVLYRKGNDKEEYVTTLDRESGPSAERRLEEGVVEGSFGTGSLNSVQ